MANPSEMKVISTCITWSNNKFQWAYLGKSWGQSIMRWLRWLGCSFFGRSSFLLGFGWFFRWSRRQNPRSHRLWPLAGLHYLNGTVNCVRGFVVGPNNTQKGSKDIRHRLGHVRFDYFQFHLNKRGKTIFKFLPHFFYFPSTEYIFSKKKKTP